MHSTVPPQGGDFDPGSFRDPSSRVFRVGDEVGRILSADGRMDWRAFSASPLLERWTADGRLVATTEVGGSDEHVELRHAVIPFWSYPYEWSFSMLRDAAMLQLELQTEALEHDLTLKDATAYNIQFNNGRPVFIDVGSFRPLEQGEPWLGYRQFCQLFLFPLMIRAYAGIPFQPLLRGSLEGVQPEAARALLRGSRIWRPGVLADVVLQARADRTAPSRDVRSELKEAGFSKEMIQNNLRRLKKVLNKTNWEPDHSTWSEYSNCEHVTTQRVAKEVFVSAVAGARHRTLAWDLGANDGYFSRLLAGHTDTVVAIDSDELVVDRLYRELRASGTGGILPLVIDLADPTPGMGWRGRERRRLEDRGTPDLALMLALIHHLVVGSNVPLLEVIDWMASLDAEVVFEWVPPDDPMVAELTVNKKQREIHPDYREDVLRDGLEQHFEIVSEAPAANRTLFHLRPRS
ncbi:MAG: methyltransferase [Acidimicrobiia bacterium]